MKNSWDAAKTMADQHVNQGGIYLRLVKDGDKVIGAFCGEPSAREVLWTGERYEPFNENDAAHQGKRPSMRVRVNFFVPADGTMKVIEGGAGWFKDVLKIRDKYGLEKWLVEIERHGGANDPKTSYTILPEERIDEGMRSRIAAARLNDLEALWNGEPSRDSEPKTKTAEPIDLRVAEELVGKLKMLPRSNVDAFLSKFGVQRIRDLKTDQEATARAFIEQQLPKKAQLADLDPFA